MADDLMSKKERLARKSAIIDVSKVIPRPGFFCKYYVHPSKMPRAQVNTNGLQLSGALNVNQAQDRKLDKGTAYFMTPRARRSLCLPKQTKNSDIHPQ